MFENKTVIVTGGYTDIGAAIVRLFANAKANVIIVSKNRGEQAEHSATFLETDVRDEDGVKKTIDEIVKTFGKIDIVINNAGVNNQNQKDLTTFPLEEYRTIIDTNMTGTFLLTKHTLPHLLKTKGSIINIASQLGLVPDPNFPVYCASKAAVVMFTKAMALRHAPDGIRINCVCPGPIDTGFLRKNLPMAKSPIGRLGTPEEVADLVLFLASEKSSYVTGVAYVIDGGSSLSRRYF